jgi:hypothetical protein
MTTQTTTVRARRSLHVSGLAYAALTLVLFFGSIQVAQYAGLWSVSGKLTAEGKPVELTGADPAEVKGWMTIQQVLDAYPVDQAALYERFGIPVDTPPSTPLKDLESMAPDFSVTDLRTWIAEQPTP